MNIFPALLGNSSIKELCGGDILRRGSSHAYIIDGPYGSGKHTAALEIAKSILCERKGESLPCGKCISCRKAAEGFNSCISFVNSGDKATISVDTVRRALATVDYLPDDGDKSIYIIEDAEKMTTQAQNALLLTLEEPPAHVVFILLTCDAMALLETVRSRCQTLKTQVFTPPQMLDILRRRYGDGERVQTASASSGGCIGRALEILESSGDKTAQTRENAERLAAYLASGESVDAMVFLREIKCDRQGAAELLISTAQAIRDMISERCGSAHYVFYTSKDKVKNAAGNAQLPHLMRMYRECVRASEDIGIKNASASTVFTTLAAGCNVK